MKYLFKISVLFFSFLLIIGLMGGISAQADTINPQEVYGTTQQIVTLQIDEDSYDLRVGGKKEIAEDGIVCKFDNPHKVYGYDKDNNSMFMAKASSIIWIYDCYQTEENNLNIPIKVITSVRDAPESDCPYDFRGIHIQYSINRYQANISQANNKPKDIGGINLQDATKTIGAKLKDIEEKLLQDSISHIGGKVVQLADYVNTWTGEEPNWDVSPSQPKAFRGNIKYTKKVDTDLRFLQFYERLRIDIPSHYDSFEFKVSECARSGYKTPSTFFKKEDTPTIYFEILDFEEYDEDTGSSGGSGGSGGSDSDTQFIN